MVDFALLKSLKLISHKLWVIEKWYNFLSVHIDPFELILIVLYLFGPISTLLYHNRPIWTHLDPYGQCENFSIHILREINFWDPRKSETAIFETLTHVKAFGFIWTHLNPFGPITFSCPRHALKFYVSTLTLESHNLILFQFLKLCFYLSSEFLQFVRGVKLPENGKSEPLKLSKF